MYTSVSEAATKFNLSKRRVQTLCEQGRIDGACMVSGVWLIPDNAEKPVDARRRKSEVSEHRGLTGAEQTLGVEEVCKALSISLATAKNWIRLGKLHPDINGFFSRGYVAGLVADIKSAKGTRLKSRRNKKSVSGNRLYKDYITTAHNQQLGEDLLVQGVVKEDRDLAVVLANFAVQLYYQSRGVSFSSNAVLPSFLVGSDHAAFRALIRDLLGNVVVDYGLVDKLSGALSKKVDFVRGEDVLGFLYISLRDLGLRKNSGAYYTPEKVVRTLIGNLCESEGDLPGKTICDPCCGSGNFLLGLLSKGVDPRSIYGQDVDAVSVALARINLALMTENFSVSELRSQITVGNTFLSEFPRKFDIIVGNPPWGTDFHQEESVLLRDAFKTAGGKSLEAYDMMVEKALSMLAPDGVVAFVLPEAILTVAAHAVVRSLMLGSCDFRFVNYLGNVFTGVQCPAVILGLRLSCAPTVLGCRVSTESQSFLIKEPRTFPGGRLSFNVSDEDARCLTAIESLENRAYLKGNAKFALGIVTGDNKTHISTEKYPGNEVILKGSDIRRYGVVSPNNFIRFEPTKFQQVAPTEMYRAKEKLLYRFICDVPVFAYDDRQRLSLNSCNILIPEIKGLQMKYVLAILNSSVAAYFLSKRFNSVKMLRSHLEELPIAVVSDDVQTTIVRKVERIMNSSEDVDALYRDLDDDVMEIYGLSGVQAQTVRSALSGRTSFLR